MVVKLRPSALKAIPITVKEFSESLTSAWNYRASGTRRPTTLGNDMSVLISKLTELT